MSPSQCASTGLVSCMYWGIYHTGYNVDILGIYWDILRYTVDILGVYWDILEYTGIYWGILLCETNLLVELHINRVMYSRYA